MTDNKFGQQRAAALTNSPTLLERGDTLGSKLIEVTEESVPSKQRVVGSNPSRDATKLRQIY